MIHMTVVVTYQKLPKKTNSLAVANGDGSFTIIVNRSLDDQERKKAVAHEIRHISRNDFVCPDAGVAELLCHESEEFQMPSDIEIFYKD